MFVTLLALTVLVVLVALGLGSTFLLSHLRRHSGRLEGGMDREVLARVLEDMDQLSNRVNQVEEELDFFKELGRPKKTGRIGPTSDGEA